MKPDIKGLQVALTGFLDKEAPRFCSDLWNWCISAQDNPLGIPQKVLEQKKIEIQNERVTGIAVLRDPEIALIISRFNSRLASRRSYVNVNQTTPVTVPETSTVIAINDESGVKAEEIIVPKSEVARENAMITLATVANEGTIVGRVPKRDANLFATPDHRPP